MKYLFNDDFQLLFWIYWELWCELPTRSSTCHFPTFDGGAAWRRVEGATSRCEWGPVAETVGSRSWKRTQTCCYWQVLPFNHKSDFSVTAVLQSIPDRSQRLNPWFEEDLIDLLKTFCTMRQSEDGEGIGERSIVWTVDSIVIIIIIIHSSSGSICNCNHVFNALLQNPPQTMLFTISVASQRHQTAIQSYLYGQGEANTAVK